MHVNIYACHKGGRLVARCELDPDTGEGVVAWSESEELARGLPHIRVVRAPGRRYEDWLGPEDGEEWLRWLPCTYRGGQGLHAEFVGPADYSGPCPGMN